jgi:hypothetical protein
LRPPQQPRPESRPSPSTTERRLTVALRAFWPAADQKFEWTAFAGRAYVTLTFGVLAAFAARKGQRHQEVERRNRRVELELASINLYLGPLPEGERHAVMKELAHRLFGRDEGVEETKEDLAKMVPMEALKLFLERRS